MLTVKIILLVNSPGKTKMNIAARLPNNFTTILMFGVKTAIRIEAAHSSSAITYGNMNSQSLYVCEKVLQLFP